MKSRAICGAAALAVAASAIVPAYAAMSAEELAKRDMPAAGEAGLTNDKAAPAQ